MPEMTGDIAGWDMEVAFAQELEKAQADLSMLLGELLYDEDAVDENDEPIEAPSGYPYCGCTVCDVRETLVVILPLIAEAVVAGRVIRYTDELDDIVRTYLGGH
jgi:hypothetical protein